MTRIVGAGPDLALIHGWGLGSSVWQPLIAALSRTWRVHLVDLPGYDDSSACSPDFTQAARRANSLRYCQGQSWQIDHEPMEKGLNLA